MLHTANDAAVSPGKPLHHPLTWSLPELGYYLNRTAERVRGELTATALVVEDLNGNGLCATSSNHTDPSLTDLRGVLLRTVGATLFASMICQASAPLRSADLWCEVEKWGNFTSENGERDSVG